MSSIDTRLKQKEPENSRTAHFSLGTFQQRPILNNHLNKTLAKLIDRFNLYSENISPTEQEKQKYQLVDRFSQIVLSQKEVSIQQDENEISQLLQDKIKESQGFEKAFRFGLLYDKLNARQRPNKKGSILYLLSLLSKDAIDVETMDTSTQPRISRPYDTSEEEFTRNTRRRLSYTQPIENIDASTLSPAMQLARAREAKRNELRSREALIHVSEAALLRDLIFIFQGIDGQYVQYDARINDYVFTSGVRVSESTEKMVFKLAELGWLYTKVRDFISKISTNSSSTGLVQQSLCATLQNELTEYYKLISVFETQLEKQSKHHNSDATQNNQTLTLKRLLVWTMEYNQKLRLMGILVDVCQDQKGGALISTIHNYTKHGDPFIKNYIINILQSVSIPFYKMLERWIYEGELDDPYDEFFVACDHTVSKENLWQSKYSLREDMLPSFISRELAHRIFSTGKSLNFIRYSCHEDTLVQQYYSTNATEASRQGLKYGDIKSVENVIEIAYKETSRTLLELLKSKYKLIDHLKALKRYLLLGQGDFIECLINNLWTSLSKPARTLYKHTLSSLLESAVRSSNVQYDDPELLNRLDVRLLEMQENDLGWHVFSLEYHVDAPMNTVFNSTAMQQYLQIFHFLWRLKRVEYTLSSAWRQWRGASREFKSVAGIRQDIQYAQLTIQRMIHFIYQLQHYVLFEVLECSWEKLEGYIETKSVDLDSIIEAHGKYLAEIREKGFLSEQTGEGLNGQLNGIFDSVLKYKTILDHLYHYATMEAGSMFGKDSNSIQKIDKIRRRHQELEDEFTVQVLRFLDTLKTYHDENLRSLLTRLDYNDFYSGFDENMVLAT